MAVRAACNHATEGSRSEAVDSAVLPTKTSTARSDNDPLYRFHQWRANLRVLRVAPRRRCARPSSGSPTTRARKRSHGGSPARRPSGRARRRSPGRGRPGGGGAAPSRGKAAAHDAPHWNQPACRGPRRPKTPRAARRQHAERRRAADDPRRPQRRPPRRPRAHRRRDAQGPPPSSRPRSSSAAGPRQARGVERPRLGGSGSGPGRHALQLMPTVARRRPPVPRCSGPAPLTTTPPSRPS